MFHLYSAIYFVLVFQFIYKSHFMISMGFTIQDLFDSYLRIERGFIQFHAIRTMLTLYTHAAFFFLYAAVFVYWAWGSVLSSAIVLTTYVLLIVIDQYMRYRRSKGKGNRFFGCFNFLSGCANQDNYADCEQEINEAFQNTERTIIVTGYVNKLILMRDWIIYTKSYTVFFARQRDARIKICSSHLQYVPGEGELMQFLNGELAQFFNIEVVTPTTKFSFGMLSVNLGDLQENVTCEIEVPANLKLYQSTMDMFLNIFRECVKNNPPYIHGQEDFIIEICSVCMREDANIKLVKTCLDLDESVVVKCRPCYCKPSLCLNCMGKWFATSNIYKPSDAWLSSKCTCPTCRRGFCIADVCIVRYN